MIKAFLNSLMKFKTTAEEKQDVSLVFSQKEREAICENGVIGLEGLWNLYDMWI